MSCVESAIIFVANGICYAILHQFCKKLVVVFISSQREGRTKEIAILKNISGTASYGFF